MKSALKAIRKANRIFVLLMLLLCGLSIALQLLTPAQVVGATERSGDGPVVVITIDGPINPASDDFLKTSLAKAQNLNARLFVIELNTPGGLLNSMQTMVESLLESDVPSVVYVTPSGGGAISAGVFVAMAGNFAVMAPGTTIGAAHPVTGDGQDVTGDMRAKVENFAVSHIKAIAEQRGRNADWAEKAVRESVAITDREAVEKKVVDLVSQDFSSLLQDLEGKVTVVKGQPVTLSGLKEARVVRVDMSLKQKVVNILADPNVTILLGLGAMLGIGIELYHPGAILPGIFGVVCLVLSLTSAQVIPINYGGLGLLLLGAVFFAVELFMPSFGIWGAAGIVCIVLGSIYLVDMDMVWGAEGVQVDTALVGSVAGFVGLLLLGAVYLMIRTRSVQVSTGREGLCGKEGTVKVRFENRHGVLRGKVAVMGEIWNAELRGSDGQSLEVGAPIRVVEMGSSLLLFVEPVKG